MLDSLMSVRIVAGELETLRVMKNSINEFATQVDSLRRALMRILDNEEDLRLLYVTKVCERVPLFEVEEIGRPS